jgi:serine/threonine protein kinase
MLMDDGTIKIADFGLARGIVGNDLFKLERMSAKGTPLYAAPNILLKEEYSVKCDVFSMGLMLYELLTGVHLFADARVLFLFDSEHGES